MPKFSPAQSANRSSYPPLPDRLLYAIGDIHGRSDCLRSAHEIIDRDVATRSHKDSRVEIYLGDYVDRGPDSKGVIELLLQRAQTTNILTLRGNHEVLMESFLRGLIPFDEWRQFGGLETIRSYGVEARALLLSKGVVDRRDVAERMPFSHFRFFSGLRNYHRCGGYLFVHAGVHPGRAIDNQSVVDLTQIREEFLRYSGNFGAIVVHGHTPTETIDFLPNRINIDTGAYLTNRLSIIRVDRTGVAALATD